MKEFLMSGSVGSIEFNTRQKIREEIGQRWEGLGLLEGLEGHIKENIATLYENEAKHILYEATSASNSGSFETVVFPIIRRVFSKLLANDIVSIQAMNLPIGKLFYLLPVTSQRTWTGDALTDGSIAKNSGMMGANLADRNNNGANKTVGYVPGVTVNATGITAYMNKSLYDLFYDDFLYDNSKGTIHVKVGASIPVSYDTTTMTFTTGGTVAVPAADGSIRELTLKVTGFNSYNPGKLTGPDGNEMDTEAFLASLKVVVNGNALTGATGQSSFAIGEAVNFHIATQKYGKAIVERNTVVDPSGVMYIKVDLSKPAGAGNVFDGYVGVGTGNTFDANTFKIAWSQYDTLELETEIGEVSFQLAEVTVSAEERKLRATWSPELAQDVAAFQNIDAEAELTAILSEQIAAEVDREILRDLRKSAPWVLRWNYNGWRTQAGFSTNYTQKDWNQELFTKINQISAQIHKSTLRGGANFIVCSTEVGAVFNNLEYFHVSDASAESDQYNMGIERVGSLNNRYQVYVDPYSPANSVIVGHHGKSMLDTGYIYGPYLPLTLTPLMYNVYNAAPVKMIATRYVKKVVNNKYYGQVIVDGLQQWSTNEFR